MENKSNPQNTQTPRHGTQFSIRHDTSSRFRVFLAAPSKIPKNISQIRWERRWASTLGAWFAVLLAVLFMGTDWRTGVMVAAAAFMLARGGDMLDHESQ